MSDAEVAETTDRTEGWPAGVYLAGLAQLARSDDEPITAFRGSDRFVSDYIRFEHLDYLSAEDQEFLVRASVLDRLSGPLCDAALHRSRSASKLEELAESNLFLIPVADARPRTYRVQNLFREALESELRRSEPGLAETIAARASAWCEKRGDVESAIEYAITSGDRDRFAELVERFLLRLYYGGRFATIARWLALLEDEDLLERHPALAATGAFVLGLEGRDEDAVRWAEIAERAPDDMPMPDGSPACAWAALVSAAICRSGVGQMREDAELAVARLAPGSSWHSSALFYLATARLLGGDSAVADEILADAYSAATAASLVDIGACALAERSLLAGADGRWDDADDLAVQARDALQDAHLDDTVKSALTYAASARAAFHNGDWVRARDDLARAERLAPQPGALAFSWFTAQVRLEAARLRMELADPAGASAVLAAGARGARRRARPGRPARGGRRAGRGAREPLPHERAGRAADPCRAAAPPAPDDAPDLQGDRRASQGLAEHREDAGHLHVPQARCVVPQRGDTAGDRARPRRAGRRPRATQARVGLRPIGTMWPRGAAQILGPERGHVASPEPSAGRGVPAGGGRDATHPGVSLVQPVSYCPPGVPRRSLPQQPCGTRRREGGK